MKLKKLKSVGHNTAAYYLSTLSLIGGKYTSTVLYQLALEMGVTSLEIDVINNITVPSIEHSGIKSSVSQLKERFIEILNKEEIPYEAVKSFKITIDLLGIRKDVVDIRCRPIIIDWNDKKYECALVHEKYPEPI